jgi:Uncharacterized protein with SCP/PR1 domains
MRILRSLAAIVLLGMLVSGIAFGESRIAQAERELYLSVNHARQAQGLPPLRWNQSLATAAIRHAEVMAERGTAQHGFEGEPDLRSRAKLAGVSFSSLSENVTQGPTPEFIHGQFMHSPHHRANILDTDMNSVGIGVVEKHGQLFAVEDFSRSQ